MGSYTYQLRCSWDGLTRFAAFRPGQEFALLTESKCGVVTFARVGVSVDVSGIWEVRLGARAGDAGRCEWLQEVSVLKLERAPCLFLTELVCACHLWTPGPPHGERRPPGWPKGGSGTFWIFILSL